MAFQDQQSGDIHATLAVSQEEALYGSSRVINLPDGRSTTVTVPAGTYDGQELRLAGQGSLITPGGPSGDLILRLQIVAGGDVRPGDDAATARASYHVPHDPSRVSSAGASSYPGWPASASPATGASFASASTDADYSGSPAPARSAGPSPYTGYSGYAVPTTPSEGTPPYAASGGYPIPPLTPAYPQAPAQPPVKKRGKTILIAILALVVVVVVGSGLGLYFGYYQPGQAHTLATQTAQAQSSATAQAAGGTAQVVQATARAAATSTAQVQATAQAYQDIYTQATRGTPDLDDPLSSPSLSSLWSLTLGSTTDGSCTFTNGAYHSSIPKVGFFKPCYALDSNYSNFAFQVDMIITRGDSGGLLLRASSDHNEFYLLRISVDGSYSLYRYSSTQSGQATLLLKGSSQLIKGLNQSNELTVVARQSTLYVYVNHQYLGSATDSAYSSGEIGVFAESDRQATEAAFSHAKVWKL